MLPYERADHPALTELETLVRHLGEELATWRRRCHRAETEMADLKAKGGTLAGPELTQVRQRLVDLETENHALRQRIDLARSRVELLGTRLLFLEDGVS